MKTKLLMAALLASAALVAPVQAGGHHGGGGGGGFAAPSGGARGGGGAPSFRSMPSGRFGDGASFRSMPMRSFGGNRTIYSGQRFSSGGLRSPMSTGFRSPIVNSNVGGGPIAGRQLARGNFNRVDGVSRFANGRNQSIANLNRGGNGQFRNGANQVRNGNNLRADWRNHVFAQHSANWHRDWDRRSDHWWHGHRCHFFNGSWVIFDVGFYPWWGPWWWNYPYDYYGYGYGYPYNYGYQYGYGNGYGNGYGYDDSGAYDDQNGYNQNGYDDQSANSAVAAAQDRLARDGYYRGQIDGVLGPETHHAIVRFQSSRGLHVTGELTTETLNALGLREYASY